MAREISVAGETAAAARSRRGDMPAPLVKRFLDHLFLDCALAGTTVTAYQRDLKELWTFLARSGEPDPASLNVDVIQQYLAHLYRCGVSLPAMCRHLATVKVFLRWLHRAGLVPRDWASAMELPLRSAALPQAIRHHRVEKLLYAPDPEDEFYLRDRALLELLYATGLRVSEAVRVRLDDVNAKLGYVRCMGPRRTERILPLTRWAMSAIDAYLEQLRPRLARDEDDARALFLSRSGRALDRTSVWRMVRRHARGAGLEGRVSVYHLRPRVLEPVPCDSPDVALVQSLLARARVGMAPGEAPVEARHLQNLHRRCHPRP